MRVDEPISIKRARLLEVPTERLRSSSAVSGSDRSCLGSDSWEKQPNIFNVHKEQVRGQRSASGPWLCISSRIQVKPGCLVSVWLCG